MNRTDIMNLWKTHQPLWMPVPAPGYDRGVYIPKRRMILSVGSATVHMFKHDDTSFEYCYDSRSACIERCKDLFYVYTARPRDTYPAELI